MSASPAKTHAHLAGLDGLRGFACLLVFVYHLRWNARPAAASGGDAPIVLPLAGMNAEFWLRQWDIGVGIFFVLSGLLLSLPYWRAAMESRPVPDLRGYLWRRICRIVPAYYLTLCVVYLLRPGTYTLTGALDFILHATFLHNFTEFSYHGVHPVLWTIGIEFQFYLLLPWIMAVAVSATRKVGFVAAITGMIAAAYGIDLLAQYCLRLMAPALPIAIGPAVISGTIFSYLKLFAFGIGAGYIVQSYKESSVRWDIVGAGSLAGLAWLITYGHEGGWRETGMLGWPVNAIILTGLACSAARSRFVSRAFSNRWMAALGTVSYGVYLWHELVQKAVFGGTLANHFSGWAAMLIGGAIALAVTLLLATLSWRWIERPALNHPTK